MLSEMNRLAPCGRAALLGRAAAFAGRPRERVVAMMDAEETLRRIELHRLPRRPAAGLASQDGLAASGSDDAASESDKGFISLLVDVILDAVRVGDLQFPVGQRPADKALGVCVLALAIQMLIDAAESADHRRTDSFQAARDAVDEFLDAQGWRPLSMEWDYDRTRDRIRAEVFAERTRRVPLR